MRRKNEKTRAGARRETEDIKAIVQGVAQAIQTRLNARFPAADDLVADKQFDLASSRLAAGEVPFATVAQLGRSSNPVTASIAHRAAALRTDVSPEWIEWAFRRVTQAYVGEVFFLLQALERHEPPPLIVRVLARADSDWSEGWILEVVTEFVRRRVAAGERPTRAEFERYVQPADEERVAEMISALDDALPPGTRSEFDEWRHGRQQRQFFESIGRVWGPSEQVPALTSVGGRSPVVEALSAILQRPEGGSVLVVGEHGVGKSSVIRETLRPLQDRGWTVFEAGPAEVLAGQVYIGQLEGRVHDIAEHAGRRLVWVVPRFEGTLWAGQHSRSPHGLLDALLPFVESGQLVVVGEVEPEAYELLVQQRPRVASIFEILRLRSLTPEEALAVASDWRDRVGANIDDASIADAHDLAQHYLASVAPPAGLLRLLKATLAHAERADLDEIGTPAVIQTLSEATGLPLHVVDPQTPLDLDEVRRFFEARVLGQGEAVECLVERIALVKANLTDPTRPLGVFLFVGPTGTGKTEIAKALAEFLFGSPDRLVRLDMSEFQTERSLERLLADSTTDDEAAALISAVRAKPFSVVLLDEFEKAHRNIWNVFLQLFDDGRLTDRQGRSVDFRQCVVILTSNLGAAVERPGSLGFVTDGTPRFRPAKVERELSRFFRPELLNRIDRVVVFRPFEREQMRALLERELAQVLARRGFRSRPWAVEWDEAALDFLAEKGFSAELGARPLKRAVERFLLVPLAAAIVSHSFPEGDQFLFVTARNDRVEVTFVDPDAEVEGEPSAESPDALRLERLVLEPRGGSEERAFLEKETARLRAIIEGEGWRGQKERDLELMRGETFWESENRFAVLAQIEYVDRVQAALRTAEKLLARLSPQARNGRGASSLVELLAERLYLLDRACSGNEPSAPSDAFVEIRASVSDHVEQEFALQLRDMYEAWSRRRGMRVTRLWSEGSHLLAVSGIGAYRILLPEAGLHVLETPVGERTVERVAVQVRVAPVVAGPPETELAQRAAEALAALEPATTIVRRYRTKPSPLVRDAVREWRTGRLDRVLGGEFDVIVDR